MKGYFKMKKIISAVLAAAIAFSLCTAAYARLVGDVNGDGSTNSTDALNVLKYSVGLIDKIDEKAADVNEDKNINSTDALYILQISVGSYSGPLEVDNDVLVTSYKRDTVDPILKTGKYTIKTTVVADGKTVPTTIMVNGNNMSADMPVEILTFKNACRLLVLDGKCYLVIPMIKAYCPSDVVPPTVGTEKADYSRSEYEEIDGKKYVVEIYKAFDGSTIKYYFLDGEWKKMVKFAADDKDEKNPTINIIDSFEAGVNEANFSLKGYNPINLGN